MRFVLRNHVIDKLEHADITALPEVKKELLTFTVIGGGFSGVETAGEMMELIERSVFYPNIARSVIMSVTNPKVAIFFLAFLPQFAEPERGGLIGQMLILGGYVHGLLAALLLRGHVARQLAGAWMRRAPGRQAGLNRVASLVFVVLAANLAL